MIAEGDADTLGHSEAFSDERELFDGLGLPETKQINQIWLISRIIHIINAANRLNKLVFCDASCNQFGALQDY